MVLFWRRGIRKPREPRVIFLRFLGDTDIGALVQMSMGAYWYLDTWMVVHTPSVQDVTEDSGSGSDISDNQSQEDVEAASTMSRNDQFTLSVSLTRVVGPPSKFPFMAYINGGYQVK